MDVEAFLSHLATASTVKAAEAGSSAAAAMRKDNLTTLLSMLLTFGINDEIDKICRDSLGIHPSTSATGLFR